MRIHPRHFNKFMLILAVITLAAILAGTFSYQHRQERRFTDRLAEIPLQEMPFVTQQGDTLRLQPGAPVVVLFWGSWSGRSQTALDELLLWHEEHPGFRLVAASVRDSTAFYARRQDGTDRDGVIRVDGTQVYHSLRTPGIPTVLFFDEKGQVFLAEVGLRSNPAWSRLSMFSEPSSGFRMAPDSQTDALVP